MLRVSNVFLCHTPTSLSTCIWPVSVFDVMFREDFTGSGSLQTLSPCFASAHSSLYLTLLLNADIFIIFLVHVCIWFDLILFHFGNVHSTGHRSWTSRPGLHEETAEGIHVITDQDDEYKPEDMGTVLKGNMVFKIWITAFVTAILFEPKLPSLIFLVCHLGLRILLLPLLHWWTPCVIYSEGFGHVVRLTWIFCTRS